MHDRTDETLWEFRNEVRAFLDEALTPALRKAAANQAGVFSEGDVASQWHDLLYKRGWIAPSWPKEFGGTGWPPIKRMIFEYECANAGAPLLPAMGLQMCGPVIIGRGTREQQEYFLPRILSGEHFWCQGYSEPQAGSDLSSLRCAAVRDGDQYVINGTKIWTTHAQYANWVFLLVRTDPSAQRGDGISFLLAPMDSPGITVRPILSMSGEHEVNQLFFDDVRVPVANRVGEENSGWAIAKYLLEFERGGGAAGGRVARVLRRLDDMEAEAVSTGAVSAFEDPALRHRRAEIEIDLMALEMTQYRAIMNSGPGQSVGDAVASTLKLLASSLFQRATELAMDAVGPTSAIGAWATPAEGQGSLPPHAVGATARYLNARAMSIFGGTSEIQHGIVAKAALGI